MATVVKMRSLHRWRFEAASNDRVLPDNILFSYKVHVLMPVGGRAEIVVARVGACPVRNGLDDLTVVFGLKVSRVVAVDQVNCPSLSGSNSQPWNTGILQRQYHDTART